MIKFRFNLSNFGFSSFEKRAIWFLVVILLIGASLRLYRNWANSHQIVLRVETSADSTTKEPVINEITPSTDNPLNINNANEYELTLLPGIGQIKAERIIDYRTKNGSFNSIDDLENVSGIGPKSMEKLRPVIKVQDNNAHTQ
ncbi:MAG: helix-hairpin-helix domain-containing protein [Candidatus Hatepunaea meridiana]|nr:helix-hairpin-helix domain-containing protein [Candidatus Hatepunaea meridiana]